MKFPKMLLALSLGFVSSVTVAQAPAGMRAPRPQLATGAAFAPDGSLWIVGLNERLQLFVQRGVGASPVQWSAPRLVDTGKDAISADGENRPKIAFGPKSAPIPAATNWAVISYTQPLAKPYTGFIRMLRSDDGGQHFSAPFTVHQDRQEITHRFESIAFDSAGRLHSFWIDKRDQPKGAERDYVGAAVYRNVSVDGGATFGPDIKLADHSCECCRIALVEGPDGGLRALWRHVFGEQTRDHAFARVSAVPGALAAEVALQRATYDEWQIKACPHHGPGLARAAAGGYHAIWFGIRKDGGQDIAAVRYARLDGEGRPVLPSVRPLPDERAEHADVAADGERVAVVWRSSEGQKTSLYAWLSKDGGQSFERRLLAEATGHNDHPRLVQSGSRIAVVWRLPQEVQVHEIRF